MLINSTLEFKNALRAGPYAWPGGYPLYFICEDGGALCCKCARKDAREIMQAIVRGYASDWRVVAQEINYDDSDLFCDDCYQQIEPAYGD